MTSAINSFEQQKQQAPSKFCPNSSTFVQEGSSLGVHVHPDLVMKLEKSVREATEQKLKVALIGASPKARHRSPPLGWRNWIARA